MKSLIQVYNFIMDKLSYFGVLPMYVHDIISINKEIIYMFDFPCHRNFHRISYYTQQNIFKYFKLPSEILQKEELLATEEVSNSKLIIETCDIIEIQNIFRNASCLEFPDTFNQSFVPN